jgi:hypothetical protein
VEKEPAGEEEWLANEEPVRKRRKMLNEEEGVDSQR